MSDLADKLIARDEHLAAIAVTMREILSELAGIRSELSELRRAATPRLPSEKPEFPYGEFDDGKHWHAPEGW